jgi:hypothetical protein
MIGFDVGLHDGMDGDDVEFLVTLLRYILQIQRFKLQI